MGIYADRVLPRLVHRACGLDSLRPLRQRVCRGLSGDVVEIGFGSGHNVPWYPASVTSVAAIEPADLAWRLADDRVRASPVPVRRSGLDGSRLPFPDGSFDAALSTWTLCTVPDVRRALGEIRRVLRPGSALHFVEHGLAPDEPVRRWQRRLEPVQKLTAGGCHLTRPVADLVTAAGFEITELETFYLPDGPRAIGATSLGVATPT